ncbi:hypothetical protein OGAPHI_003515 [Ogataea philodendri]|uniref:Uncharacterized protein n=1 Tax=Ogataea philodendri TaxID=1378263 RepID=A0A9P8P7R7_9ASCO|nr:uncharacterized protein OGAPHI_003515 [Ogataea philodendri]KAH3666519.1 hypothetical protein OGAPHI_003515 [Ogataea philodendri]
MFQGSVSIRSTTITADHDELKEYLANLNEDLARCEVEHDLSICQDPLIYYDDKLNSEIQLSESSKKSRRHKRRAREHRMSKFYNKIRESLVVPFKKQVKEYPSDNIEPNFEQDVVEKTEPQQDGYQGYTVPNNSGSLLRHDVSRASRASRRSGESVGVSQRRSLSRYSSVIRYPSSVIEVYIGGDLFDNHQDLCRQYSIARARSTNGSDDNYSMASLVIPGSQAVAIRRDSILVANAASRRGSRLYSSVSRRLADIEQGSGSTSEKSEPNQQDQQEEISSNGVYSFISETTTEIDDQEQSPNQGLDRASSMSTDTLDHSAELTNILSSGNEDHFTGSNLEFSGREDDDDDQSSFYSILQSPPHFHQ